MTGAWPLLPTSVVGSHALPGWLVPGREAYAAGRLGPVDLRELVEDATRIAIAEQVEAGIDLVANREMAEIELMSESADREVAVGVVDVKAYRVETADEVAARLRLALRHVAAERLWVVPDCGFWATPRAATVGKLTAMVAGTRLVRGELRG